jgi:gliding motility-associated-like protein
MVRSIFTVILALWFHILSGQALSEGHQSALNSLVNQNTLTCDNWLKVPSQPSFIKVGDLDVPGNKITIEAVINRTTSWSGGPLYAGDIVSKHTQPTDVNYLLRPNHAEITTSNGYFRTPDICNIDLNKNYHVAMVYDGVRLKFYRNGFLMSQIAASGNLFQNNFETRIGYYWLELYNTNFIGYINEVRIWNVARSQSELQAYMNSPLPSPTTQIGLLAYYTFDNLINKQGNPAWNGTLRGSATINETNPICPAFTADSCCPALNGTIAGSTICLGSPGTLTFNATSGQPPYTLTYSDGTNAYTSTGVQSGVPFTVQNSVISTTTYTLLSIKDGGSCSMPSVPGMNATIVVNRNSVSPDSIQASQTSVCAGSPIQLSVSGGSLGLNSSWKWYESDCGSNSIGTGPIINMTATTTKDYFVRAEGGCNTTNCVSIPIIVAPKPSVVFDSLNGVCIDEPDFKITQARETTGLSGNGTYSGNGINSSGFFSPTIAGKGNHTITYNFTSTNGCSESKRRNQAVHSLPTIDAGKDILSCPNSTLKLGATGGITYAWLPASGLSNPTLPDPVVNTPITTTYYVKGEDANGCTAIDSMVVFVSENIKEKFKMPNAFSPNDDGSNDCFGLKKWGNIQIKEFSIFNRWGQKIFTTRNASECWDGKLNGIRQETGGYVYIVRVLSSCEEIILKGVVMLIR